MYHIDKTDWGFHLTFGGVVPESEMKSWVHESRDALSTAPESFWVFADIRKLMPLDEDAREAMVGGQRLYRTCGMERSAVIVDSMATVHQFRTIARESGIYEWERYFGPGPDAEEQALAWVRNGVDPDD